MIHDAQAVGSRVALVEIPEYIDLHTQNWARYEQFDTWARALVAREKGVAFFNFNSVDEFPIGDGRLFFDTDHLNAQGAELFSKRLSVKMDLR